MSLIVYNTCKAMKLLIITWVHICISFNKLIWLIQKNYKIDILSLLFMPFTGNKSPGAKKGSDEWRCDNFTNIFWVKRTFKIMIWWLAFEKAISILTGNLNSCRGYLFTAVLGLCMANWWEISFFDYQTYFSETTFVIKTSKLLLK